MNTDRIFIACDHGGFDAKMGIIEQFTAKGHTFKDVGCDAKDICRYPHFASVVASAVSSGEAKRGILICSTGIGMSIFANKYKGVRAALCTSSYMAKMTRLHNDSNILCLGGKITGILELLDIVEIWLSTGYEGGRHDISLGMIREAEADMHTGKRWISENPRI